MTKTLLLYFATAVAEIIGCYLPYCYVKREGRLLLLLPAALSLMAFVGLLMLHPAASGRVYAAYGGMYILTCAGMAEVHRRHKIIPPGLVGGGGGAVWRHDHDKRLAPRRKLIGAESGTGLAGFACACLWRKSHYAAAAQVGMPSKPRKIGCAAADAAGRGGTPGAAPLAGSPLAVHAEPGKRLAYRHHFQHIDIDMGGQGWPHRIRPRRYRPASADRHFCRCFPPCPHPL